MRDLHARMLAAAARRRGPARASRSWRRRRRAGRWRSCCRPAASPTRPRGLALEELSRLAAKRLRGERRRPEAGRAGARGRRRRASRSATVLALRARATACRRSRSTARRCLRTAALAALAEVAVSEARDEVERRGPRQPDRGPAGRARSTALSDGPPSRAAGLRPVPRRGRRWSAEVQLAQARAHAAALIDDRAAGVRSPSRLGDRIYAILPAQRRRRRAGADPGGGARTLASRLRPHGPAAVLVLLRRPRASSTRRSPRRSWCWR